MAAQRTLLTDRARDRRSAAMITRSPLDDPRMTMADRHVLQAADRHGIPYLAYRDCDGIQRLVALTHDRDAVTLGRGGADLCADWDRGVSRQHATLLRTPAGWSIVDDGASLNGTYVNRERVQGVRALQDRDLIQIGELAIAFRRPS
jgi:hypothetical protein